MTRTPPNVSDRFVLADWLASLSVGKQLKHLDMRGRRDLLDLFTKSAGEMLDQWFESEPLKAVLGWDSVVGNFASPYTPGSAYVLLHHVFGEVTASPARGVTRSAAWERSRRRWRRSARRAGLPSKPMRTSHSCWSKAASRSAWRWRTGASSAPASSCPPRT